MKPILEACYSPSCRNPSGPDGMCRTCRSTLNSVQRARLRARSLGLMKAVVIAWQRHQSRGRN